LKRSPINEPEFCRTVYLYGVAGRQRTPVATAFMKLVRGANWLRYLN
jgi:hypothetical protein